MRPVLHEEKEGEDDGENRQMVNKKDEVRRPTERQGKECKRKEEQEKQEKSKEEEKEERFECRIEQQQVKKNIYPISHS